MARRCVAGDRVGGRPSSVPPLLGVRTCAFHPARPHPASVVTIRGPRSRAGFMQAPEMPPKAEPSTVTVAPTSRGAAEEGMVESLSPVGGNGGVRLTARRVSAQEW